MAAMVFGALVGPAVSAGMAASGRAWIGGLLGLITVVFASLLLLSKPTHNPGSGQVLRSVGFMLRRPAWHAALGIATAGMLLGAVTAYLPPRLSDLGLSGTAIGGLFLVAGVAKVAVGPLVGHATDKVGARIPSVLALTMSGAAVVGLVVVVKVLGTIAAMFILFPAMNEALTAGFAWVVAALRASALPSAGVFAAGDVAWAGGEFFGAAGVGWGLDRFDALWCLVVAAAVPRALALRLGASRGGGRGQERG